jgi:hypothetical protein
MPEACADGIGKSVQALLASAIISVARCRREVCLKRAIRRFALGVFIVVSECSFYVPSRAWNARYDA